MPRRKQSVPKKHGNENSDSPKLTDSSSQEPKSATAMEPLINSPKSHKASSLSDSSGTVVSESRDGSSTPDTLGSPTTTNGEGVDESAVLDLSIKRRKISDPTIGCCGQSCDSNSKGSSSFPRAQAQQTATATKLAAAALKQPMLSILALTASSASPKSLTPSPAGGSSSVFSTSGVTGVNMPLLSPTSLLGNPSSLHPCTSSSSSLSPLKQPIDFLTPTMAKNDPTSSRKIDRISSLIDSTRNKVDQTSSTSGGGSSLDALSSLSSLVSKVGSSRSLPTLSPITMQPLHHGSNADSPLGSTPGGLGSALSAISGELVGSNLAAAAAAGTSSIASASSGGLNFQDLWLRFVKKEENAELKRMNEARKIFTCLQCETSFQSMDQLVKHMEATQHYTNIPKHYSWSLQMARQRMRHMKMKMKYSDKMMYFCFLCQQTFTEPVHVHFNCMHNMHNPAENMKFVHIISVGAAAAAVDSSASAASSAKNSHSSTNKNSRRNNRHHLNNSRTPISLSMASSASTVSNGNHPARAANKFAKKESALVVANESGSGGQSRSGDGHSHGSAGHSQHSTITGHSHTGHHQKISKLSGKLSQILNAAFMQDSTSSSDYQSKEKASSSSAPTLSCGNSLSKMEELVAKKTMKLRSSDKNAAAGSRDTTSDHGSADIIMKNRTNGHYSDTMSEC